MGPEWAIGISNIVSARTTVRLVVLFAVLATSFASFAQSENASLSTTLSQKKKRVSGAWNFELTGDGYSDEQQQAQTAGLGLNGKLNYSLLRMLELKAAAGVSMQSGYAQSRFGDNTPSSGVALKEAVVVLKPFRGGSIQAGAIDQGHLNAPLLVASQPFPGVKERLVIGTRALNLEIKAQQTIPTSKSLSTRAVEAEVTPSFTTETAAIRSEAISNLKLLAYGTHFAFRSLPSTVAIESERYGNTVTPVSAKTSRFMFDFDGYVVGAEAELAITRALNLGFEGQLLQNSKADQSFGAGQYLGGSIGIALAGDVDLKSKSGYFFAESDVAPGFYNSSKYGHNNRVGWTAGLEAIFKQQGFKMGGEYVSADLVNPSSLQSRLSYFQIRFETLYDFL